MTASPDIVSRITQNINVFQRSKVRITGPLEMVNPAARKTDIIKHPEDRRRGCAGSVGQCADPRACAA